MVSRCDSWGWGGGGGRGSPCHKSNLMTSYVICHCQLELTMSYFTMFSLSYGQESMMMAIV